MISSILNDISSLLEVDRNSLSFALTAGGIYKEEPDYKKVLLVFKDGSPFIVAKWAANQSLITNEFKNLEFLNQRQIPAPKALALRTMNSLQVSYESFIAGQTVEEKLRRKLLNAPSAVKIAQQVLEELFNKTNEQSSIESLKAELTEIFKPARELGIFTDQLNGADSILHEEIVATFSGKPIYRAFTHGDFLARNIIANNNQTALFDCEFSQLSHFYCCDWLRFFIYSSELVHPSQFQHGLVQHLAFRSDWPTHLASYKNDSQALLALSALNFIVDFNKKSKVCPNYLTARLAHELKERLTKGMPYLAANEKMSYPQLQSATQTSQPLASDLTALDLEILASSHFSGFSAVDSQQTIERLRGQLAQQIEIVRQQKELVANKDQLISAIAQSPTYRVGKLITTPIKIITQSKKIFSKGA